MRRENCENCPLKNSTRLPCSPQCFYALKSSNDCLRRTEARSNVRNTEKIHHLDDDERARRLLWETLYVWIACMYFCVEATSGNFLVILFKSWLTSSRAAAELSREKSTQLFVVWRCCLAGEAETGLQKMCELCEHRKKYLRVRT